MPGEYFNPEDPRDLDGEPDAEPIIQRCDDCGHRTSADVSDCPECGGELEIVVPPLKDYDPTPWCSHCGSMTRKGCDCGPIADNN